MYHLAFPADHLVPQAYHLAPQVSNLETHTTHLTPQVDHSSPQVSHLTPPIRLSNPFRLHQVGSFANEVLLRDNVSQKNHRFHNRPDLQGTLGDVESHTIRLASRCAASCRNFSRFDKIAEHIVCKPDWNGDRRVNAPLINEEEGNLSNRSFYPNSRSPIN